MLPNRKLYVEPHERKRRLAELGLEEEWLQRSVKAGQLQRVSCTPHHPLPYAGISAWAETIKMFRDIVIPKGWRAENPRGLPLVLSPKGSIAITVATGDDATGKEEFEPCTKCPKGPQTRSAVSNNQMHLFPNEQMTKAFTSTAKSGQITWLLLIHSEEQAREMRCELSLPVGMNEEGKVDGWEERIILGSTPFDADTLQVPNDDVPQTPNITFNVKRRA